MISRTTLETMKTKGKEGIETMKDLWTDREKEIIYLALSRLLDNPKLEQEEFNEIDNLRDFFYTGNEMPTF